MYIPDNILITLSPIIERYVETNSCYYPKDYKSGSFTVFLLVLFNTARLRSRIKICIYVLSCILIFITNIQECGLLIIQNQYLKDIRVVANGAVLTFIVFDRLVNEYQKMREKV